MPVRINELNSTVHAFDGKALLSKEVLTMITRRVAEELRRAEAEQRARRRDTEIDERRAVRD